LKKVMLLPALLAIVVIAAAPALAQVEQEDEQEGESGEVDQSFEISGSGSNANQCAPIQATGQSGNSQDVTDLIESNSDTDDFEFEENGSTITTSPSGSTECVQEVNQAASAAAAPKAAPAPAPAPKAAPAPAPAPKAAPAPAPKPAPAPPPARKAEAKKAGAKKAGAKKAEKKQLPKTGGSSVASLFALGAGALLVGGGLLARRFIR
jgi:LPXTG-motif cell wall-anchored protein